MLIIAISVLLPISGLALALARPQSRSARLACVGVAALTGAFYAFGLIVAHRVAELDLRGVPPSADWQSGVSRMQEINRRSVAVLVAAGAALVVIGLVPFPVERTGQDADLRRQEGSNAPSD